MPARTPVELLHADYAHLQHRHGSALAQDPERSLRFYEGELASMGSIGARDTVTHDVAGWLRTVNALEVFVDRESRMPRENRRLPVGTISAEEKTLANRVRAQRRAFAAGRLCTYQVRRLLCIPGFSFHPLDDQWQANCGAYARFTAQHRDAPKLSSTTPSDRVLARWAAKTRMAYRAGTLPPRSVDAANRLEFWHWGTQPTRPR